MNSSQKAKVISSAIVGNIVEYYDFGIYAAFSIVLSRVFFPEGDEFLNLLYTLMVFALSFMARPIGGIVFGYIGDKFGRKLSLTISILGMAFSTFLIGILPGYQAIGAIAPIILCIMRIFQGLCVGGEGAGTAIFVLEHFEGYRPGFISSVVMASNIVGTLLATFVGIIIINFFGEENWRWGFIFGSILGFIGLYMRHNVDESPAFEKNKNAQSIDKKLPFFQIIRLWKRVLVVMLLGGATSSVAYTIRGYMASFFVEIMGYTVDTALHLTIFGLLVMIITIPLFGLMSDRHNHKKFLHFACIAVVIFIVPAYKMISIKDDMASALLGITIIGVLASAISAPAYAYAMRAFKAELRFSGVAFSWNLGHAMFGGMSMPISLYLSKNYGHDSPSFYLMLTCGLFAIASFLVTRDKKWQ